MKQLVSEKGLYTYKNILWNIKFYLIYFYIDLLPSFGVSILKYWVMGWTNLHSEETYMFAS